MRVVYLVIEYAFSILNYIVYKELGRPLRGLKTELSFSRFQGINIELTWFFNVCVITYIKFITVIKIA